MHVWFRCRYSYSDMLRPGLDDDTEGLLAADRHECVRDDDDEQWKKMLVEDQLK